MFTVMDQAGAKTRNTGVDGSLELIKPNKEHM